MAARELRREVEYSLRDLAAAHDMSAERTVAISSLLRELQRRGKAPPSTDLFLEAWPAIEMDVLDLDSVAVADAVRITQQILLELTAHQTSRN